MHERVDLLKVKLIEFKVDYKDTLILTADVILMSLSTLNTFNTSVYRFHIKFKIAFSWCDVSKADFKHFLVVFEGLLTSVQTSN